MSKIRTAALALAFTGAAVFVLAAPGAPAGGDPLPTTTTSVTVPCVKWQNTNPSAYVEVCPPLP